MFPEYLLFFLITFWSSCMVALLSFLSLGILMVVRFASSLVYFSQVPFLLLYLFWSIYYIWGFPRYFLVMVVCLALKIVHLNLIWNFVYISGSTELWVSLIDEYLIDSLSNLAWLLHSEVPHPMPANSWLWDMILNAFILGTRKKLGTGYYLNI